MNIKFNQLRNRALTFASLAAAISTVAIFSWILGDIVVRGASAIDWAFLWETPQDAGRSGGIFSILASTAWILVICLGAAVPVGLGAAIVLTQASASKSGPLVKIFRLALDLLASIPSIVFGLFGNAFFCNTLGLGYSILSGGLTLACMVLPFFTRACEASLLGVPRRIAVGAAALGFRQWRTMLSVIIPAAMPGITVGLVLATGRALAETSALLFTSGYIDRTPASVMDSGRAISVHIYELAMNVGGGDMNAYRTAFVLITLLLLINSVTMALGHRWHRKRMGL